MGEAILTAVITAVIGAIIPIIIKAIPNWFNKKKKTSTNNTKVEAPEIVEEKSVPTVEKESITKSILNKIIDFFTKPITICCILYIISLGLAIAPVIIFMVKPIVTVNSFLFWFSIVAFVVSIVVAILWLVLVYNEWLDYDGNHMFDYCLLSAFVGAALAIVAVILLPRVSEFYFWLFIICSVAVLFIASIVCVCFRSGREGKIFTFVTNCMFVATVMFLITSEALFVRNLDLTKSYKSIFTYQNHYYMKNEDGTLAFVMSDYNEVNLVIPGEVKGKTVTSLKAGPEYLEGNKDYVSIVLPESIEDIPYALFWGCSKLESLTLPVLDWEYEFNISDYDGKAMIQAGLGDLFGATEYENSIAVKQLSEGYFITGDRADKDDTFSYTYYLPKSLHSVTMSGGVVRYGTFMNCTEITEVKLNVEGIENGAFENCGAIKQYEGVSYVDNWVIKSSNLLSYTLKEDTVGIADIAFVFSVNMGNITLNENLKYIGSNAFNGTKLTEITIPESVIRIGKNAFVNCDKLVNATFNNATNWYVNDTYVSSESLLNTETAARYLKTTYTNYVWTRRA